MIETLKRIGRSLSNYYFGTANKRFLEQEIKDCLAYEMPECLEIAKKEKKSELAYKTILLGGEFTGITLSIVTKTPGLAAVSICLCESIRALTHQKENTIQETYQTRKNSYESINSFKNTIDDLW